MNTEDVNLMFRAFGDPIRLRTLRLLREDEMCVGDLVEVLQVPQPTVSRHLGCLRRAGLVDVRNDGRWCFYSLRKARTGFHRKLLDCLGSCFREVPELKEDRGRAKRVRKAGGCCPLVGEKMSRWAIPSP